MSKIVKNKPIWDKLRKIHLLSIKTAGNILFPVGKA